MPDAPNRGEIEKLWRGRLQDAKLRLDFARSYLKEVQRDFQSGEIPSADGSYAHQKALRAEIAALAEYQRVLRVVTDLLVNGIIPGAEDSPGRSGSGNAA